MSGAAIVAAARECLGTPFIHQGRQKGVGMDCAGILAYVFTALDLPYNDVTGYPRHPYKGMMRDILDGQPSLVAVPGRPLFVGAVLLMRIKREPQHIAIYSGQTVIHSFSTVGRVIEHTLSDDWRRRIMKVYEIVER